MRLQDAVSRLQASGPEAGAVWLVGAGPGDPGLLTLHALQALTWADVVLHDALVSDDILSLVREGCRLEPVGKRAGRPSARQMRINERLVALAREGLRVVRLKGGDPLTFGRGGEEALALAAAGIPFRIVPGVSAASGAAAAAGIPLTHRGIGRSVVSVTGHSIGDPEGEPDWQALAAGCDVLALYMAVGRASAIAERLIQGGRPASEPVALISAATTAGQQVLRTTLARLPEVAAGWPRKAPTLLLVGPVVALEAVLAPCLEAAPMRVAPRASSAAIA